MWSRINLIPLLQAEADRDAYRREAAMKRREEEIMKDVPEWDVSVTTWTALRSCDEILLLIGEHSSLLSRRNSRNHTIPSATSQRTSSSSDGSGQRLLLHSMSILVQHSTTEQNRNPRTV